MWVILRTDESLYSWRHVGSASQVEGALAQAEGVGVEQHPRKRLPSLGFCDVGLLDKLEVKARGNAVHKPFYYWELVIPS